MLVCDKCSAEIPDGSRFCPACADPVTDADLPSTRPNVSHERVNLVCPKCDNQERHEVPVAADRFSITCSKCGTTFDSRLVVVRAKRSTSSKKDNRRSYSVRVQKFGGQEELIEFVNAGTSDFELRSRDIAAFSYLNGHVAVVQNLKINQYLKVSKPSCFLATCVYGPASHEVALLREWRDSVLLPSPAGAAAVTAYYVVSPLLVPLLRMRTANELVRALLVLPLLLVRRWCERTGRNVPPNPACSRQRR